MGEERPVEVHPKNKHVKSDALLKSKAGNYCQALCTHLASDRVSLSLPASSTDYTGHHTLDGFWSLVIMWMTFQNDSLDLGLLSAGRAPSKPVKIHVCAGQNQVQSKGRGLGLSNRSRGRSKKSTLVARYQVLKSPHLQQCMPRSALAIFGDQRQRLC